MDIEAALHDLAQRQHNLINRAQARERGLFDSQWKRLVQSGGWVPVTRRVLRAAGAAPSRGEQVMAAVLDVGLDSEASHSTGAWWWGVPGFRPVPIQLVRTTPTTRRTDLARVHRVRFLPPEMRTTLHGIPVVRPEVVILQLCATEHPERAARALDNAWNLRLLSGKSVMWLLSQYGERGRNGTALLRQLIDERGEDYTPPASNLEARMMVLCERAGIAMERQIDSGGEQWTGRVDFRGKDRPLIVEVQSERYHSALLDRKADDERRAQLEADGFTVVEVTDVELWRPDNTVVDRIRLALRDLARRSA